MKAAFIVLMAASAAFAAFSLFYGLQAGEVKAGYYRHLDSRRAGEARRYDSDDDSLERVHDEMEALHTPVKILSLVYFGGAMATCVVIFRKAGASRAWKTTLIVAMVLSVLMALWSLGLSSAISFDEVFPAWMLAAVSIGVVALVGLLRQRSAGLSSG